MTKDWWNELTYEQQKEYVKNHKTRKVPKLRGSGRSTLLGPHNKSISVLAAPILKSFEKDHFDAYDVSMILYGWFTGSYMSSKSKDKRVLQVYRLLKSIANQYKVSKPKKLFRAMWTATDKAEVGKSLVSIPEKPISSWTPSYKAALKIVELYQNGAFAFKNGKKFVIVRTENPNNVVCDYKAVVSFLEDLTKNYKELGVDKKYWGLISGVKKKIKTKFYENQEEVILSGKSKVRVVAVYKDGIFEKPTEV